MAASKEWRKNRPEYMVKYRLSPKNVKKIKARNKVSNALYRGRINKKPCEICGDPKSEAHHDSYDRPLDVRWLCIPHHTEHHVNERKKLQDNIK